MVVRHWYLLLSVLIKNDFIYGQPNCSKRSQNFTIPREMKNKIFTAVKPYIPVLPNEKDFDYETSIKDYETGLQSDNLKLTLLQLIAKNGYPVEEHNITTSDGYVLKVFRIPGNGSVVFLMHGIQANAATWATTGKERALAYLLADAGHDVWIGNARGTTYGKRHINLLPNCKEFWNFSFDDIGRKDLPAMIDYILEKTGKKKLQYIGHSQGTTVFFVMASERPEYNDKIEVMIALSAVAYMSNAKSIVGVIMKLLTPIGTKFDEIHGHYEVFGRNAFVNSIFDLMCDTPAKAALFCNNINFVVGGIDYPQLNATYLPLFYKLAMDGASSKQYWHYGQMAISGKFRQYDYGSIKNLNRYGSLRPPKYPLEKITAPVVIFYANNDLASHFKDVKFLANQLPKLIELYRVPYPLFGHNDYMLANDVKTLVYDKVMTYLKV